MLRNIFIILCIIAVFPFAWGAIADFADWDPSNHPENSATIQLIRVGTGEVLNWIAGQVACGEHSFGVCKGIEPPSEGGFSWFGLRGSTTVRVETPVSCLTTLEDHRNVRSGQGADSEIISTLAPGDHKVLENQWPWLRLADPAGWVFITDDTSKMNLRELAFCQ